MKKKTSKSLGKLSIPSKTEKTISANSDFQQIHDLVKLITENNIGEISFEKGDYKLTIKQKNEGTLYTTAQSLTPQFVPTQTTPTSPTTSISNTPSSPSPKEESTASLGTNLITVRSPMIGTFYLRSSPDKPVFVEVGMEISKGKVLCLIEAMKLFNEVESDVNGKVVKILVDDSSPVEYDQPLFLVEPK